MYIKKGNGRLELAPPTPTGGTYRLGKVSDAVNPDEAVSYRQLLRLEQGDLQFTNLNFSEGAITALVGGGQTGATALSYIINNISTVATAGDSVVLPTATVGKVVYVLVASGATASPDIFPATGAQLGVLAANTAIRLTPGTHYSFEATSTTVWRVSRLGVGAINNITAFATGGQTSATKLAEGTNIIGTCATAGDSVKLPLIAFMGEQITVKNGGATAADVFPNTSGTIDGGSADAAVRIQPGQLVTFISTTTTGWQSTNSASGTVTQGTSITTAVTLNAVKGVITTLTATSGAAGATPQTFTVNNSFALATSNITATINNYSGTNATNGIPAIFVDNRGAGTFDITVSNMHGTNALNGTLVISFVINN